jgi:hypothetical protein
MSFFCSLQFSMTSLFNIEIPSIDLLLGRRERRGDGNGRRSETQQRRDRISNRSISKQSKQSKQSTIRNLSRNAGKEIGNNLAQLRIDTSETGHGEDGGNEGGDDGRISTPQGPR